MIITTLQINLAPGDFRMARHVLPHQLRVWREQVDEVLLVVDLHRSTGRFADGWEEGRDRLLELANCQTGVRTIIVDYSEDARSRVANEWTGGAEVPTKDFRGGPSYAYFFGLSAAKGRFVLHSDADMFFGGGSKTWVAEAIALFERHSDILFIAPHSGPPAPDGRIRTLICERDKRAQGGQRFEFMSTRLFMLDKTLFRHRIVAFRPLRPCFRSRIKARVEGNPSWDLPEHWMTRAMQDAGMCRFEFSGSGPGMWSLHPPYRCDAFFQSVPELIRAIDVGNVPEAQRGCHDINETMVDWSEAIEKLKFNRWWSRLGVRRFIL